MKGQCKLGILMTPLLFHNQSEIEHQSTSLNLHPRLNETLPGAFTFLDGHHLLGPFFYGLE